jgi:hypothetical protein
MVPLDESKVLFGHQEDGDWSPQLLIPAQSYAPHATSPYQRLLLAILDDAIRCFQHNFDAKEPRRRILFRETEHWLFDPDGREFMSCPTVCESLGIDSVALRRSLREWQAEMNGRRVSRMGRSSPAYANREIPLRKARPPKGPRTESESNQRKRSPEHLQ